jgi:hypothetical protein
MLYSGPFVKVDCKNSALNYDKQAKQRSLVLEVGYVVALLAVFFVGLVLVEYFAHADKSDRRTVRV